MTVSAKESFLMLGNCLDYKVKKVDFGLVDDKN